MVLVKAYKVKYIRRRAEKTFSKFDKTALKAVPTKDDSVQRI